MRYKVPQDIDQEDKIFLFVSMRQLIYLVIGFFFAYMLYSAMAKIYTMSMIESILLWFPLGIAAVFAFVKVKGMTLFHFILVIIEQLFFRPPKRFWQNIVAEPFVSSTFDFRMNVKKITKAKKKETVRSDKFKEMAEFLDGEKSIHKPK